MRLKAEIWIKAYIRRCAIAGAPAVVVRHGDDDAGAIFLKINRLDGTCRLYGPAPAGLDGADRDRSWMACVDEPGVTEAAVDDYLRREAKIDPDFWLVEVEDRQGRHFLEDEAIASAADGRWR